MPAATAISPNPALFVLAPLVSVALKLIGKPGYAAHSKLKNVAYVC